MNYSSIILTLVFLYGLYIWLNIPPRVEWTMSSQVTFDKCEDQSLPVVLLFGATSMLGKYIVSNFKSNETTCLLSFGRSACPDCDLSIRGDVRDARLVERVLKFYKPDTLITSIKPPLVHIHYKTYIEINLLSMVQLVDLAQKHQVSNFIYVSSIAAAGHYFDHHNSKESEALPYYTDFEAPYDISKRFAEDYLLERQSDTFNTIAIRVGGIIGGQGDPYEHLRYPVLFEFFPATPGVDVNFAGNVAEAIVVVYKRLRNLTKQTISCEFCGKFYYYTGEPMTENEKSRLVSKASGKPIIPVPRMLVQLLAKLLHWARFDPNTSNAVDLMRMGLVPQTFDQTKFLATFPEFKPVLSLERALKQLYGVKVDKTDL